ncbi:DUF5134 domain-containing protein [Streptomyces globosus]|uniref:DUF5134 domain-containing protein n=1 Tax=Streptomyces globosus TaxID=68209 RepID=A0A344U2Y0_9ACTN|nr:DUF5134 domain-containing protein [Streptomyces globosus]AXE25251.1 DUF5134 domain-containing protein [Streptomyces globosus]
MSSWSSFAAALPAWLTVLVCAVSGGCCLHRACTAGRPERGPAAGEAVMAVGMAVMALPPGTAPWGARILPVLCCGAALHAVWLLRRGLHHTHHLVGSLAMAYMALAVYAGGGHGGHGGGGSAGPPLVTGALLLYYAAYVLLGGARLVAAGPAVSAAAAGPGAGRGREAGEVARACRLAMGTGMLAMLLLM